MSWGGGRNYGRKILQLDVTYLIFALQHSRGYYTGATQEFLLTPHIQSVIGSTAWLVTAHDASQSGKSLNKTARVEGAAPVVCGVGLLVSVRLCSCQGNCRPGLSNKIDPH